MGEPSTEVAVAILHAADAPYKATVQLLFIYLYALALQTGLSPESLAGSMSEALADDTEWDAIRSTLTVLQMEAAHREPPS